jgi:hypothetical protein
VSAEVKLAIPVDVVGRPGRRSASITCLIHLRPLGARLDRSNRGVCPAQTLHHIDWPPLQSPPLPSSARSAAGPPRRSPPPGGATPRSRDQPRGPGPALAWGGAGASAMSWRTQRIRLAAWSGWSPNSCAIRAMQPGTPNCRTVRSIASATLSAVGASDGCSPDANSASRRASFTFCRPLRRAASATAAPIALVASVTSTAVPSSLSPADRDLPASAAAGRSEHWILAGISYHPRSNVLARPVTARAGAARPGRTARRSGWAAWRREQPARLPTVAG